MSLSALSVFSLGLNRRDLTDLRALVTGASSGIGRALAIELGRSGVKVLLLARNGAKLIETAEAVRAAGGEAIHLAGDVTDPTVRQQALAMAREDFGGLDLLINNAGTSAYGRFVEVSPERLRKIMEVNLFAAAEFIREATPLLRASTQAAVVNVGSILGERGLPFCSEYCASKFALHGLSEAIRPELEKIGIDLLLVAPGSTATEFSENVLETQGEPPWTRSGGVTPEFVAKQIVKALTRRKRMIIPNRQGWWLLLANRLVPGIVDRVMRKYG